MKSYNNPFQPLLFFKYYISDSDFSVLDPLSDEASDYFNADLPYPYDKVDDAFAIIKDNIQPPNGGKEDKDEKTHFNENISSSNNIEESTTKLDEETSFLLPKETQRNISKGKVPGPEEQEEIFDKKIEKKNGKSKTRYLVKWKNKQKPTWHVREGLSTTLVKEFNAQLKKKDWV